MNLLATLPPPPVRNSRGVQSLFPEVAKTHHGRMKVQLGRSIIQWIQPKPLVVADPMVGSGSSIVAADQEECSAFVGADIEHQWIKCCLEVGVLLPWVLQCARSEKTDVPSLLNTLREVAKGITGIDLILTSPPFPNAHTQGASEMQEAFQEQKSTYAGNEFENQKLWATQVPFTRTLTSVLRPWIACLSLTGHVAIHIKNFIRNKQEVRADEWVGDALHNSGLKVLGYLSAPLEYRSLFQENLRYPLRLITQSTVGEGKQIDVLECGHRKIRDVAPKVTPKQARCVECGVVPGHVEIREERVVVASRS